MEIDVLCNGLTSIPTDLSNRVAALLAALVVYGENNLEEKITIQLK